jgi:hypothetical protein
MKKQINQFSVQELENDYTGYLDFISFLLEAEECGKEVVVITGENWDKYYATEDEDYDMEIEDYFDVSDFYERFSMIAKMDRFKFDEYFISAKYINEMNKHTMNLVMNINGVNKRFIIDAI